jgi:hypothetical protein
MGYPFLFEVNARQWISGLRERLGQEMNLGSVPDDEIDRWVGYGVTHVWLMGVWPTGAVSRGEALRHDELRLAYSEALPGWEDSDVRGSPYAVESVRVDPFLGGDDALGRFRKRLNERGVLLVLDFVPNHLGRDHEWVNAHPERFVGASEAFEGSFRVETQAGVRFLAHGKDPFFPGWTDTVQVEYRSGEAREAMMGILESIADRCDGVRCDMAMLVLSDVFQRTWTHLPHRGACAGGDFWELAIGRVRRKYAGFLFLAEAYWGMEERLCGAGFDYAYDKTLYDRLVHDDAEGASAHILGMGAMNARRAHFLENHDEPRVATLVGADRMKSALVASFALPGMRFLHDGQREGFRRFSRIQLGRRAVEAPDNRIMNIHDEVFLALRESSVGKSRAQVLAPSPAWEGNDSHRFIMIVLWCEVGRADLVVVNMAPHEAQCRVQLDLSGENWVLRDRLGEEVWERSGREMRSEGLYLDLAPRKAQIFCLMPSADTGSDHP